MVIDVGPAGVGPSLRARQCEAITLLSWPVEQALSGS